jgi:hypothetical protein
MRIRDIRSTDDALVFGQIATEYQVAILEIMRESALKKARLMLDLGMLEDALKKATTAQFYREAIESHNEGR